MSLRQSRRAVATMAAPLLAVAGAASVASAAPVSFGENAYDLIFDDQLSWTAAQTAARSAGGDLATITSAEEQSFIEGLLADRDAPTGAYWFGLAETATEGQYAPINGEQSSFTNFAPGEPNNGAGLVAEDSGSIYWTGDADTELATFTRRGTWNDVPEEGYPHPIAGTPPFPDLLRAGYLVEFAGGAGGGDGGGGIGGGGDGGGIGGGNEGGGGGGGGQPNPIPIPPAALAFPGAAALAYWANRRMRRGI